MGGEERALPRLSMLESTLNIMALCLFHAIT